MAPDVVLCAICEEPATCMGASIGDEREQPSCDACCSHDNELGYCSPIGIEKPLASPDSQADGHRDPEP